MNKCYVCNEPATSKEHVPPRCLFPHEKDGVAEKNLRKDLITVPSCDLHNLKKSGDDEYLLYILTMHFSSEGVGGNLFATKGFRAIERRPALMKSFMKNAKPILMKNAESNETFETLEIQVDGERVAKVLEYVALGVYKHHFKRTWLGKVESQLEFLHFSEEFAPHNSGILHVKNLSNSIFTNQKKIGENPEVFYYQVFQQEDNYSAIIRLIFYGECKTTAVFSDEAG